MASVTVCSTRAALLNRYKRNRDHTNGIDAVKEAGTLYLPVEPDQTTDQYDAHKASTDYYPAAARTLESHIGLVFRKQPKLTAPPAFEGVTYVTADGETVEELARWALREYMVTNDGGLLVDMVGSATGLMLPEAIALDLRPFVARYEAENVEKLTYGVVGGRKRLIKVELIDDVETKRHLELVKGIYNVRIFKMVDGAWIETEHTVPAKNNAPLTFIPFIPLTDGTDGAAFDDLCALNHIHYLNSAKLATALLWISAPVVVTTGVEDDVQLSCRPGAHWRFGNENAKCGFNEYTGAGVPHLRDQIDRIEDHLAKLGSRLLATDKAAPEAAETLARRQASENSILASMARHISARVEEALRIMADWMGIDATKLTFTLSTDFIPSPIDPQLLGQLTALNQNGKLTDRELFDALQRGEIISEGVDFETHQAELDTALIDPPIAGGPTGE